MGYTIANELSARDLGRRDQLPDATPFKWDWVGQKCFDDACPIGPWIVPASDIKDPQKLGIKLWVNDVIKQDSNTSDMIFNLAEQLSHLSSRITLYPGDIILTGTPAGVGAARKEFLKAGDTTRVWVEGIGTLTNKMACRRRFGHLELICGRRRPRPRRSICAAPAQRSARSPPRYRQAARSPSS